MKRPVILIFPTRRDDLSAVSVRYTDAVRCHGGLPLVVPMNTDAAALEEMCAISDGFMFTGGVDIAPSYYNEEKLNDTVETDEVRDTLEMTAIGYVLASGKPVLGICRGIQSVNVGMGGTLYQDIPAQLPDPVCEGVHVGLHLRFRHLDNGNLQKDLLAGGIADIIQQFRG